MAFFKKLADGLNHVEYPIEGYEPDYFDQNIVEIAFFHNLIFIRKGNNDEKTNTPKLIQREVVALRTRPRFTISKTVKPWPRRTNGASLC